LFCSVFSYIAILIIFHPNPRRFREDYPKEIVYSPSNPKLEDFIKRVFGDMKENLTCVTESFSGAQDLDHHLQTNEYLTGLLFDNKLKVKFQ
jgi:hypothetical protein